MRSNARYISLALFLALPLTGALAQDNASGAAQRPAATPRELTVAPNAPQRTPEPGSQAGGQLESNGAPANICNELVAYLKQPKPGNQPGAASAPPQPPAPNAPAAAPPVAPGQTAPAVDRPQQSSGQSAPIAGNDHQDPTASRIGVDQAEALLKTNDLKGCKRAAKEMRRAGVALPAGLLALAAMREDLLIKSGEPAGQ